MAITINGSSNTITGLAAGGLPDNTIDNGSMADDAIGVAELSATGTASSSTYLRGDNAWATIAGGDTNTPGFQAYKNDAINITMTGYTEMVVSSELWDSSSAYDTSNGRFTPQTAGTYYVYFSCTPWTQSDKVNFMAQIRKNGAGSGSDYGTGFTNVDMMWDGDESLALHTQGIFSLNGSSDYVSPGIYFHDYTDQSTQRRTDLNYFGGFRIGAAF